MKRELRPTIWLGLGNHKSYRPYKESEMSGHPVKDYEELVLSTGEKIKVHRVPQSVVRGVVPSKPRPRRPMVAMQIAGGKTQQRPAKEGDAGWEDYLDAKEQWETEKDGLQGAISLVMALREYKYPEDMRLPDHVQQLLDSNLLPVPTSEYGRKALWLRSTVLSAFQDEMEVDFALQRLSGVDPEVITQIKSNFRDTLLGKKPGAVGIGTEQSDSGELVTADSM